MKNFISKEAAQDAAMQAEMPMQAATRMPAKVSTETPKAKIALILAVFNSTIFEEVRNSVGNATAYMHKGQNVVKKKDEESDQPEQPRAAEIRTGQARLFARGVPPLPVVASLQRRVS